MPGPRGRGSGTPGSRPLLTSWGSPHLPIPLFLGSLLASTTVIVERHVWTQKCHAQNTCGPFSSPAGHTHPGPTGQPSSRGPHPLKPGIDVVPASSHLPLIWKFCCLEQLKRKLWFLRLIIFPFFPRALAKCQTFLSKFFGIKAGNGLQSCEERTGNEARDGQVCPPRHTHCHTTPPLPPCTAPR